MCTKIWYLSISHCSSVQSVSDRSGRFLTSMCTTLMVSLCADSLRCRRVYGREKDRRVSVREKERGMEREKEKEKEESETR